MLTNLIAINCGFCYLNIKNKQESFFKGKLHREIDKQFNNYLHFEKTPSYHNLLTEQLISYAAIKKTCNSKNNQKFLTFLEKLIFISKKVSHPDKKLSFFNDTNYDSISYNELELLFSKNFEKKSFREKISNFSYPVLSNKKIFIISKFCGPSPDFNPGHSHADSLSFEASINNKRFIINKGISTYEKNYLRLVQRSTKSHNSVEINNLNSSQVWSSFRVGKKSNVFNSFVDTKKNIVSARHNGNSNIFNDIIHFRKLSLFKKSFFIYDEISGKFKSFKIFFHFAPDVKLKKIDNLIYFKSHNFKGTISFNNTKQIQLKNSVFYPNFGVNKKIKSLIINCKENKNLTKINIY